MGVNPLSRFAESPPRGRQFFEIYIDYTGIERISPPLRGFGGLISIL